MQAVSRVLGERVKTVIWAKGYSNCTNNAKKQIKINIKGGIITPIIYKQREIYGDVSTKVNQEPSIDSPVFDSNTSPQVRLVSGCFNLAYGFQICWELDPSVPRAEIELKLLGTSLGKWVLDATHTCVHIGINVGLASASLDLCANWIQREITLKGEVCRFGQCIEYEVVLFKW